MLTIALTLYESSCFCGNVKGPSAGSLSAALASWTSCSFVSSVRSLSALTTTRMMCESCRLCGNVRGPSAGCSSVALAS